MPAIREAGTGGQSNRATAQLLGQPEIIRRWGKSKISKPDPDTSGPMAEKDYQKAPSAKDLERWRPVWGGIDPDLSDESKLDALVARFKANTVGFRYRGASRTFALDGDCGSLVRTFKEIASRVLEVDDVKTGFTNGAPGWYVPPGFHEIDPDRDPNMDNGGYYFKTSHVWAVWNGTVYDVLFGEKGQNGMKPDEGKMVDGEDGSKTWHFRIGGDWYRSVGETNTYASTPAPG